MYMLPRLTPLSPPDEEEDTAKAALANQKEKFLSGFVQHVLLRVGKSVQTLSLAHGGEVDSDLVSCVMYLPYNGEIL